jgi:hypothetical protein
MRRLSFDFPEDTLAAMEELAEITGVKEGKDRLAKLIQDAVRLYEWVLFQQLEGKIVTVLEKQDWEILRTNKEVHGEREYLEPLFSPGEVKKALDYFQKAKAA